MNGLNGYFYKHELPRIEHKLSQIILSKAKMKKKRTNESQAEKFSGRRGEILRTERRNSPDGAENGSRTRKRGGAGVYEYVVNPYGLRIKKCCASCALKMTTDNLHWRECLCKHKRVRPTYCCGEWMLNLYLEKLGREKGMVRDRKTGKILF